MQTDPNSTQPLIQRHEGQFKGHQGLELFFQTWTIPAARGTLVISHGISEHSECYSNMAVTMAGKGWNTLAWDLRGHGRSEGKRGYVEDFNFYALDLKCFLHFLKDTGKLQGPFTILGHSMGGLITLRYMVDRDTSSAADRAVAPKSLVLSSPLLGIAMEVPFIKDAAAKLLKHIMPSITLSNEIHYEYLTHDPAALKSYPLDPLRHDKISPALYFGMYDNMAYVKERVDRIQLPTLIQAAGQEKVVSLPDTRAFFEKIAFNDKKLIVYDESLHEIYNDLTRDTVLNDLDTFLTRTTK